MRASFPRMYGSWSMKMTILPHLVEVKNEWSYTSNPPTGLHGVHRNITFTSGVLMEINRKNVLCNVMSSKSDSYSVLQEPAAAIWRAED
jgi:hypothetical protein